jgi:hypothetical protein
MLGRVVHRVFARALCRHQLEHGKHSHAVIAIE